MGIQPILRQGFIPVITGGKGVDALLRPFVHLLSSRVMVAYPHAIENPHLTELPLSLFIDSGSFGFIKYGGAVTRHGETASLTIDGPSQVTISPKQLLAYQEQHGAVGFTLDIPPRDGPISFRQAFDLSFQNALWALNQRKRTLPLLASLPAAPEMKNPRQACAVLLEAGADGIALGNLIKYRKETDFILELIREIRSLGSHFAIHLFGFGQPEFMNTCFLHGATTTDSSSYVQYALAGKLLQACSNSQRSQLNLPISDPSPIEMRNLALQNLALLTGKSLPFSFAPFPLHTADPALQR